MKTFESLRTGPGDREKTATAVRAAAGRDGVKDATASELQQGATACVLQQGAAVSVLQQGALLRPGHTQHTHMHARVHLSTSM